MSNDTGAKLIEFWILKLQQRSLAFKIPIFQLLQQHFSRFKIFNSQTDNEILNLSFLKFSGLGVL